MKKAIEDCVSYFSTLILDKINVDCWVAGGALRDYFIDGDCRNSKDIDIFFKNNKDLKQALDQFNKSITPVFSNDCVTNFKIKGYTIQFIGAYFFKNPQETINKFDFTACSAAVDKKTIYFAESFFEDINKKSLIIQRLPYPCATLKRLQRYVKKGFTIDGASLHQLAIAINEMDPDDIDSCFYDEI